MPENVNSPAWLRQERSWLRRARKGDRQAFASLYKAFARPLYNQVLLPRLGDTQAAEDALAETFRAALERLDQFQEKSVSIWFWLMRIAKNKAMDVHRAHGRGGKALASYESLVAPLRQNPDEPATRLELREESVKLRKSVEAVLGALNPRYRRVLELRFLDDLSRQECAERLEIKLGTLDVLVLRALRAFRREWSRTHE